MRRPIWRHGVFASVLALTLALVGAASVADAKSKTQKPSLTVSAPASVTNESRWSVLATGFSGPYNTVTAATEKGITSCPSPEHAFNKHTTTVAKQQKFKVKFSILEIVESPETRTLCVFLYKGGGKYVVKTLHYQI